MSANKLNKQQKEEIIQKYTTGNYSCKKLGEEYNCSHANISYILKKHGVEVKNNINKLQRKYKINENYFDIIDNEHKAYWLGFLYADGCITNTKRKQHISLSLQERDGYIVQKFVEDLDSNIPIIFCKKKKITHQNQYKLQIYNQYMVSKLIELGCHPHKSFTITFPTNNQVPKYLIHHFIRGLWDGDGSFIITKNKNDTPILISSLVSTLNICTSIQEIIKNEININSQIRFDKRCQKTTRQIFIGGSIQVQKLAKWLYKDATIYLERKYNKVIEYQQLAKEQGFKTISL